MSRKTISSGTKSEEMASYSRAVVDDDFVVVSGTTGMNPETGTFSDSIEEQLNFAFSTVENALQQAGASLSNVLICRAYLTDREYVKPLAELLSEKFADILPANTTVICQLPPPKAKVELEIIAKK